MDIFEIPDDYKPEKYMTQQEINQTTNYLTNHPLFMKDVPTNLESNPHLSALQNLIYDEDPQQLAENMNKQGNQRLKQNPNSLYYMKEAYKKYTEGIHAKSKNPTTNAKLHCNRAAINLKIKNFGKVIQDCKMALKYDANYAKAYYRYGCALQSLKKYQECIELLKDRKQAQIVQLKNNSLKEFERFKKQQQQKQIKKNSVQNKVAVYCKSRGWKMKRRSQIIPGNIKLKFIQQKLSIPLLLLYPQFSQFDVIQNTFEDDYISGHVQELISPGLPWDTQKYYRLNTVEYYIDIEEAVMARINPQQRITDLLKKYIFPEAIQITVVSKSSKYYQKFIEGSKIIKL